MQGLQVDTSDRPFVIARIVGLLAELRRAARGYVTSARVLHIEGSHDGINL